MSFSVFEALRCRRNQTFRFLYQIYAWDSDNYTEFSKMVQDKVVGTQIEAAHVYDLNTGKDIILLVGIFFFLSICRFLDASASL